MRTNEELNRVIAEWHTGNLFVIVKRGLYYRENAHGYTSSIKEAWHVPLDVAKKHEYNPKRCDDPVTIEHVKPCDYCNDLNAIHEAEEKWCSSDLAYNKYSDTLFTFHLENQTKLKKPWRWIITTARERSEVLVKMIEGKQE